MWGVLRNDVYVNKKANTIRLIVVLFWSVLFFLPIKKQSLDELGQFWNIVYFLAGCITAFLFLFMANASIAGALQEDEKTGWMSFLLASPVTVKKRVWMKYIETFALYVLAVAYALLLFRIVKWNNDITIPDSIAVVIGLFFLFQSVIELPLAFRVGSGYGNYVKMGAAFFILLVITLYLLYGPIDSMPGTEQFFAYIEKLENGEQSITEWIRSGMKTEKVLIFVGIIGLYVLSGVLSCRIFNSDKEA